MRAMLADEDLTVSRYQLERWRRLGLMPRPTVVRSRFGGSAVLPHDEAARDAARVLAEISTRGRPWQYGGVLLFGDGLPLSETCLRNCGTWIIDRVQRRLRSYWAEATLMASPVHEDPQDEWHEIAEIAVRIAQGRRVMRPVMRAIRNDVYGYVPRGTLAERRDALSAALIYRFMDVAAPGSLTKEEEFLAITGQEATDTRGITPLTPSDIASCAATLTVGEAYVARDWLVAAWNIDVMAMRTDTFVLEDVLLMITDLRLTTGEKHHGARVGQELLDDLAEEAEEMYEEYVDGRIPGQQEFDLGELDPDGRPEVGAAL